MALEQIAGVVIYQGEDKDINIRLANETGDPFNLNGVSEIVCLFAGTAAASPVVKRLTTADISVTNAGGGQFKVSLKASDTVGLMVGENQSIEIRATINSYLTVAQVMNAVSVYPSLFPNVSV